MLFLPGTLHANEISFEDQPEGRLIDDEYQANYGITITTVSSGTVDFSAIFNSSQTGTADPDLEGPPPTAWVAGNLAPSNVMGNILIIQENATAGEISAGQLSTSPPDDEALGGTITFDFDKSLDSFGFDWVDLDSVAATNYFVHFIDTGNATTVSVEFAEMVTPASMFYDASVTFGDATANRIQPFTAADLAIFGGVSFDNFDRITFELEFSGAIGGFRYTQFGSLTNRVTITADQTDSDLTNNTNTYVSVVNQESDLSITKADSSDPVYLGQNFDYTIAITNAGPSDTSGVIVTDTVPAEVTFVGFVASTGSFDAVSNIWTVGDLPFGASETITLTYNVDATAAGVLTNVALVAGDATDTNAANNTATELTTVAAADVGVTKAVDDSTPLESQAVAYTILATNSGPQTAINFQITDVLPSGVSYDSDTGGGDYVPGTGIWSIPSLNSGATTTLVINVIIDPGTGGSTIVNTAAVTSVSFTDSNAANDSDTASLTVQLADLALSKSVSDATPNLNDLIDYTIVVTNSGPDAATSVLVEDVLPAGVTYDSDTGGGDYNNGTGIWDIGTLANGATTSLTITVQVASIGTVTNIAQVNNADQADPDSTPDNDVQAEDDQDEAVHTVMQADLALIKGVSDATPNVNDFIDYNIVVTNSGPDAATSVLVEDVLPAGVSYNSDTGGGDYNNGTGIWDIGSLANGATTSLTINVQVTNAVAITNIAQVNASDVFDPNSTPDNDVPAENDQDNAVITPMIADLALTKGVSDTTPNLNDNIDYTITVTNAGPDSATTVLVEDVLPAGVSYNSDTGGGDYNNGTGIWDIGSLANGATTSLTINVQVTSVGTITNTAQVNASDVFDPDSSPGNSAPAEDDQDEAVFTVQLADLGLEKVVDNVAPFVGQQIIFTITVTNNGPDTATGVEVVDDPPAELTNVTFGVSQGSFDGTNWTVGTISAGNFASLSITGFLGVANTFTNVAEVTASDQADPNSTPNNNLITEDDQDQAVVGPPIVDVGIFKAVSDAVRNVGDAVAYTLTATNAISTNATGVVISDLLPSGVTYLSASSADYTNTNGLWNIGDLGANASTTLTINVTVDAGTGGSVITNQTDVQVVNEADLNPTNDTASVTFAVTLVDVEVTKTVSDPFPNEGDAISYTIIVTNFGPDTATSLVVTDSVPAGVTFIIASSTNYVSATGLWTIGDLASGASTTLTVDVTVDAGTGGTSITNIAEVSALDQEDSNSTNNSDSAALTVQSADLELTKGVSDTTPNLNDIIDYTITVTNAGPDSATGVLVEDVLPGGVSYVGDDSGGAYTSDIWTVGTLTNGASASLTITVQVTSVGTIINTAQVNYADQFDPNSAPDNDDGDQSENDEDNASLTVQQADLALTKGVSDTAPTLNDFIDYTIIVTNEGPNSATSVLVEDVLPAGVTYDSDTGGGDYINGTGIWTIGTLANGASTSLTITVQVTSLGTITNTAQVNASDVFDPDSTPDNDILAEDDQEEIAFTVIQADLAVIKTAFPDPAVAGSTLTYTIVVTNSGPDNATSVVVQELLPAGVTLDSFMTTRGSYDTNTMEWTVGILTNNTSETLTIDVILDSDL